MSSWHPSTSPLRNRSASSRSRSAARFPADRQQQQISSGEEVFQAPFTSGIADDLTCRDERPSSADIHTEMDAVGTPQKSKPMSPFPDYLDGTYSASNQHEQCPEPDSDAGGFASYFGGNDSFQQEDDMFIYDGNAQYTAETCQYVMSAEVQAQSFQAQDTYAPSIQYDHNYNNYSSVSNHVEDDIQQIEESQVGQKDYQGYYQQAGQYAQGVPFIDGSIKVDETVPDYWNPTDYSQDMQACNDISDYYGAPSSGYHQEMADQNFYGNQHDESAGNQQYFQDIQFNDVDLNGPVTDSNAHYRPVARSKSRNSFRPPDPHPIITFAFGGRVCFSLIRTRTLLGHRSLSQDIEIKIQPGKLHISSTDFLLRETPLAKCISEYPGPVSSSSNILAFCRKLSPSCPKNDLLWKFIDILASNKGSWDTEKVTALLTSSGSESGNGVWLGSGKIPSASSGSAQPLEATEEDLLHIQALVTTGKHVEAAEFAASRALWSHALIISMNCDDRVHLSLIQRYRDCFLLPGSQLYTVYSALAECPIQSTESWKENLAALLNARKSSVAIYQLGELLLSENDIVGSHACFLLSGRLDKISLLALPRPSHKFFQCPYPESVQLTECFELSVRQKDSGFTMEALIYARMCYACLLIDMGHNDSALRYIRIVLRSITDMSRNKKQLISKKFVHAVRVVEHQLSQIASSDSGSESSGVLGSIFNNLSKLLIGKEEQDVPKPAAQPANSQVSLQQSSFAPESTSAAEPNTKQTDNESAKNANIISKITGLFRSRNPSPQGDVADFEEEKFEWDPVTKKWISNINGPAQPPPPAAESTAPVRRPPRRPNVSGPLPPRTSLSRTQISTRYALQDRSESSTSYS